MKIYYTRNSRKLQRTVCPPQPLSPLPEQLLSLNHPYQQSIWTCELSLLPLALAIARGADFQHSTKLKSHTMLLKTRNLINSRKLLGLKRPSTRLGIRTVDNIHTRRRLLEPWKGWMHCIINAGIARVFVRS